MSKYNGELFPPGSAWKSKGDKKECTRVLCADCKNNRNNHNSHRREEW